MMTGQQVKDGRVMIFAPPMITGYSVTNGFELEMQDKTGGDINEFFNIVQQFLGALNQCPEIQMAYTTFNPSFPQYQIDIDAAKANRPESAHVQFFLPCRDTTEVCTFLTSTVLVNFTA